VIARGILIASIAVGAVALVGCGASSKSATTTTTTGTDATTTTSGTAPANCEQPGTPPKNSPALAITPGANYTATMETSEGTIVIALNACTQLWGANNFVVLARKGFYNNTAVHRVAKSFVIQGGDPKGNGTGGPGYEFVSEVPATKYQVGDIAWAKTGAAPPGSAGSQWFIITTPQALMTLTPDDFDSLRVTDRAYGGGGGGGGVGCACVRCGPHRLRPPCACSPCTPFLPPALPPSLSACPRLDLHLAKHQQSMQARRAVSGAAAGIPSPPAANAGASAAGASSVAPPS
jgi:cyclophilin family peptidyl-prolyl cis-trans isomerase